MMAFARLALGAVGLSPASLLVYGAIAAAALVGVGGVWKAGYNYAQRKCEVAALQSQIAAKDIDLAAAENAAREAEAARVASEAAAIEDRRKVEE